MSEDRTRRWTIEHGVRVELARSLYLSFERTRRLSAAAPAGPPTSYGAAPVTPLNDDPATDVVIAVRDDEAIWLGLSAVDETQRCAARIIVRQPIGIDAVTGSSPFVRLQAAPQNYVVVPPQHAVVGVAAGPQRARQFVRVARSDRDAACERIDVLIHRARIEMSHPATPAPSPLLRRPDSESPAGNPAEHTGLVVQRIALDPFGVGAWDPDPAVVFRVALLAPDAYAHRTGTAAPPPIGDEAGYRGWRLP